MTAFAVTEQVYRVSVDTDTLTWVTDICVVLAAVLALVAIVVALYLDRRSTKRAEVIRQMDREAAALERRLDFELDLLASLSHQWNLTGTPTHVAGYVRALIRDPNDTVNLLVLRNSTHVHENTITEVHPERRTRVQAAFAV